MTDDKQAIEPEDQAKDADKADELNTGELEDISGGGKSATNTTPNGPGAHNNMLNVNW